jgi:ATP-dependent RNA helicase DDX49/DBP8
MMTQALELSKRPHVIVATPGRFRDHLESCSDAIFLKRLQFLVLDEADRLLDETFADDLSVILNSMPKKRQTLLFSATMTTNIQNLANPNTFVFQATERYTIIFFVLIFMDRFDTVAKLDQRYIMTPSLVRDAHLVWLLRNACEGKSVIIFTGKCRYVLIHSHFTPSFRSEHVKWFV